MIQRIREFFTTPKGKAVALVLAVIALGLFGYSLRNTFGDSPEETETRTRTFICSETGKVFKTEMQPGWGIPVPSPYSGKNTGFIAEMCPWTKDGHLKADPTPVLLNEYAGKSGPTFCPECGRLVVARNPVFKPGDTAAKVPPTQTEYASRPRPARDREVQ